MKDDTATLRRRIEVLERRVFELSRAAARIGASLDPDRRRGRSAPEAHCH